MLIATSRLPSTHSGDRGSFRVLKHFEGLCLKQKSSQSHIISLQCSFCELRTKTNKLTNPRKQPNKTSVNHFRFFSSNLYYWLKICFLMVGNKSPSWELKSHKPNSPAQLPQSTCAWGWSFIRKDWWLGNVTGGGGNAGKEGKHNRT